MKELKPKTIIVAEGRYMEVISDKNGILVIKDGNVTKVRNKKYFPFRVFSLPNVERLA